MSSTVPIVASLYARLAYNDVSTKLKFLTPGVVEGLVLSTITHSVLPDVDLIIKKLGLNPRYTKVPSVLEPLPVYDPKAL
jgi:hypothetical protein